MPCERTILSLKQFPAMPQCPFALGAAMAAFALAAFSPAVFHDSDTYWQIAAGGWMLDHHAILHHDIFSYTKMGAPWHTQEWLAEIVMALAFRLGGWAWLHALFAIAAAITAAIMGWSLRARMAFLPAFLTTLLGLACVGGSLLARPHMLALPLLAFWVLGLMRARERDGSPDLRLIAIMPLWANLHGGFAFGLAIAAALGIEAVIESAHIWQTAKNWGLFVALATLSALITPDGVQGLLFPLKLTTMTGIAHIGEWQASNFSHLSSFEIALLSVLFVLAGGKVRVPRARLVILLALTYGALLHARYQMLFGVAGALLLAPALAQAWPPGPARTKKHFALIPAAGLVLLLSVRHLLPEMRGEDAISPRAALARVPQAIRTAPVLNDYAFGGFLIFNGVKPFIDSRADVYSDSFLNKYAAITAPDKAALAAALVHYHVRWTIFRADAPVVKILDTLPGWHRLYGDDNAVVDVRD
jgi:hypothetical protein